MIKKSGGRGPGGCNSGESCRAFCDNPDNQEACFKFSEEYGFSSKEETQQTKQGFVRLRSGLENMPPEVAACLKSTVGPNIIDDIQSGKLVPGQDIGESMRACFEKFGQNNNASEPFQNAPPEVMVCLQEKLGDEFEGIKSGKVMPTPEVADTFRICFQKAQFQEEFKDGLGPNPADGQGEKRGQKNNDGPPPPETSRMHNPDRPNISTDSSDVSGSNAKNGCEQAGGIFENNYCKMPGTNPVPSSECSDGQRWDGSACVSSSTTTQTPMTTESSGTSSTPEPMPSSSDMSANCAQAGGSWDGSVCIMPTPPTSLVKPSFGLASTLDAVKAVLWKITSLLTGLK